MRAWFSLLHHSYRGTAGGCVWPLFLIFWYGLTEDAALPRAAVWFLGFSCANYMMGNDNWERSLRIIPVDMKKLIALRVLFSALAAFAAVILYILGSLLGKNEYILSESMAIFGGTLLSAAVGICVFYGVQDSQRRMLVGSLSGAISLGVIILTMQYRAFRFVENMGNTLVVNDPLPLGAGVFLLGLGITSAAVACHLAPVLEQQREW